MNIVLGTNNKHKAEEMRAILREAFGSDFQLLMPTEIADFPADIPETGATLEENALIKATVMHEAIGLPCVADDTGLEVFALDGAPGVYSARFAGEGATYADNRRKLMDALEKIGIKAAPARFRTVICYADGLRTLFAEGVCDGTIIQEERGEKGFGYDAIFVPNGYSQTFGELTADEKNKISHRARALTEFVRIITPYFAD